MPPSSSKPRKQTHRVYYPNAKKGEDPRGVKPLIKAENVVDKEGVRLRFLEPTKALTPSELKMLARWLFALAGEAEELAHAGLITERAGYDVSAAKVVASPVDT